MNFAAERPLVTLLPWQRSASEITRPRDRGAVERFF